VTTPRLPFDSSPAPPRLREVAEEPEHFLKDIPPPVRRLITPRFTILFSPSKTQSVTMSVRTTVEDVDAVIAEVRRAVREVGHTRNLWQVGPSCRPHGLSSLLAERGFIRATRPPFEPSATAMALARRPAISGADPGIEVRLCGSVDDYREAIRIAMEVFNETPEDAAGWYDAVPALWAAHDGVSRYTHLAFLDGKPAGFGFAAVADGAVLLGGSGVLESARRRGVYRALVAARWEEAVRLGHEGLVIHAGSMSKSVLSRCGFEPVCELEIFEDVGL
jgi:GNAT superfamily N-acetyltransferase